MPEAVGSLNTILQRWMTWKSVLKPALNTTLQRRMTWKSVLNTLEASFEHNPLPADSQFWLSEMKPVVGLYDELTVSFDSPR